MAKICIVGDYDSICGFGALGIDTFPVTNGSDASKIIKRLHDQSIFSKKKLEGKLCQQEQRD